MCGALRGALARTLDEVLDGMWSMSSAISGSFVLVGARLL